MAITTTEIEERVNALEDDVARLKLKEKMFSPPSPYDRWWESIAGVFAEDELFEEAVRLGQEYRASQNADEQ